jgi:hypothetical protein
MIMSRTLDDFHHRRIGPVKQRGSTMISQAK